MSEIFDLICMCNLLKCIFNCFNLCKNSNKNDEQSTEKLIN